MDNDKDEKADEKLEAESPLNNERSSEEEIQLVENASFGKYLCVLQRNHEKVLRGDLAQHKQIKPILSLETGHEMDKEDFYHMQVVENHASVKENVPFSPNDHFEKLQIDEVIKMLPEAPEYKIFYSVDEALKLSMEVVKSGKPNYAGLKVKVKSGFNTEAFRFLLQGYENAEMIVNGVTYGWPLGWTAYPLPHCQTVPNHPTVEREYPLATKEWLQEQIEHGMIVGPFPREKIPWRNISTIPLHSVVKDEQLGTRRFCADPSFVPRGIPEGWGSINQGIPKGQYLGNFFDYRLPKVRDFVKDAIDIGLEKVKGFKIDWSHAYRQNPLCPGDWWLTMLSFDEGYYLDIKSNFGFRSSGIFNQMESEAIPFMLNKIKFSIEGKWRMRAFFDDEVGLAEPQIVEELFQTSLALHKLLGIRVSVSRDHVIPPTRKLIALGIVLDFDLGVIYMPPAKLDKLRMIVQEMKEKEFLSRHDLLLNHWAEVVVSGRIFVNRMLKAFRQMSPNQDLFCPSEDFWKDLRWWERAAPFLNYKAMMIPKQFGPENTVDMDASTSWGMGAVNYINKEFFMVGNPPVLKDLPIHCGEMAVLMLVVDVWAGQIATIVQEMSEDQGSVSLFKSSHVVLKSDNQAVISTINNGRAVDDFLGIGMRYVHHQMALRDSKLSLSYVKSKENVIADGLSRGSEASVNDLISSGFTQIFVPCERLSALLVLDF